MSTAVNAHGGPHGRLDFESETFVAIPIAASLTRGAESAGKGGCAGRRQEDDVNLVAHAYRVTPNNGAYASGEAAPSLTTGTDNSAITLLEPVAHALRAEGFDASEDGTGRGTPLVPVWAINSDCLDRSGEGAAGNAAERAGLGIQEGVAYSMRSKRPDAVAFSLRGRDGEAQAKPAEDGLSPSLRAVGGGSSHAFVAQQWAVRRLTPTECERLMGVPDGFTAITYRNKPAADGPRYKALGNSQATNVMRWIGHGLADVMRAPP